ncbi:MAG TPA: hypothetical protein VMW08_07065 [Acidimicrobiales bacterium]|nr:hypothetical protein [Acidimicrobiales bacterium]
MSGDLESIELGLRRELAQLDARLAAIPSDQFSARSGLLEQRQNTAEQLRTVVGADPETLARWAERAGSKDTSDGSKPFIRTRSEPG